MSWRNIWINFDQLRHINPWKKCRNFMQFLKYLAGPFLRPLRSKNFRGWILRLQPRNFAIISSLRQMVTKSDLFDFDISFFALLTWVSLWGTIKKNQNFGTVCHTEDCLTFSRLAAKLSEMITNFWCRNLKIQHQTSFDLNGLKKALPYILKIASVFWKHPHWNCRNMEEICRGKLHVDMNNIAPL